MAATCSTNPGFAFVVNSLLKSNKNAKVLSKAKKESDTKIGENSTKDAPVEVVGEDGQVIQSSTHEQTVTKESTKKVKNVKLSKITKHQLESIGRTKPKVENRERERRLSAIATKGVVQLFNVVKEQQKNIKHKLDEVGTSSNKRAKVLEQFDEEGLIKKVNEKGNKVSKSSDWIDLIKFIHYLYFYRSFTIGN